jgi:signal transduction histidine kinase/CheY-like chemotaxis protein
MPTSLASPPGQNRQAIDQPAAGEPFASRGAALRITLIYAVVGGVWILLSDRLVYFFLDDNASAITFFSIIKGWVYVFLTAALLYQLIERAMRALRRARQTADAARLESERANRAKDRFLAVLSHELRTPLTPVLATVSSLQRQPGLDGALREDVELIRRNIEMESRLIDDLLDLTRIATGKLHMEMQVVDVHEALRSALLTCAGEMKQRKLELDLRLEAGEHCVRADPTRLTQVFWNLLCNAVKFTPDPGKITIRTQNGEAGGRPSAVGGKSGAADSTLTVEISDTGVGIVPEFLPRIFDAFQQSEDASGQRLGGLGLGLAISRPIAEQFGGTLAAASEGAGKGATFTVKLPVVSCQLTEGVGGGPLADGSGQSRTSLRPALSGNSQPATGNLSLRILLVEDNVDSARMLARLLRMMKHRVRIAGSVQQALAAAGEDEFDLLLSDIALPDGSGLDVMLRIRERQPVPGIALSGFGMEDDIQRSLAAGFSEHLTKPVTADRLEEAIARVFRAGSRGAGGAART